MALSLTCPACHEPQTVPDEDAGQTVRCPKCRTEYTATAAAPAPRARPTPARSDSKARSVLPLVALVLFVLVVGGGAVWYFGFDRSRSTDYADPDGVFTARFPNPPETARVTTADPMLLRWGERVAQAKVGSREYAVAVLDGLNPGDQEMSPATRDAQIETVIITTATNLDGKVVHQRPVAHEGHAARELLIVDRDSRATAVRLVVGERSCVRMTVGGVGDRDKPDAALDSVAAFFGEVHLSPAFGPPIKDDPVTVSAADLGAAYQTDPKAADARFKDRWVRVTGPVTAVAGDGKALEMRDGETPIAFQRATRGRMSVQVRKGASATVTGKCSGLSEATAEGGPRVTLTEAVVLRPANPKPPK